jgi:hypothetical protein
MRIVIAGYKAPDAFPAVVNPRVEQSVKGNLEKTTVRERHCAGISETNAKRYVVKFVCVFQERAVLGERNV